MKASAVLDALERREEGVHLLPLLGERVAVVGGFVRDALLGRTPREVDLLVEGDAAPLAAELAARTGGSLVSHTRFGTHTVSAADWRVDIAAARSESYAAPGALPDVRPATIEEDLERRDFTINAIALRSGELLAVPRALEDLSAGLLRALHERSFTDDPTRLGRLARYAERLNFAVEPATAALAAAADLRSLSPARLGAELRLALAEPDPAAVLKRLPLGYDARLAARALALAPPGARTGLILLAACRPVPAVEATAVEQLVLGCDAERLARGMQNATRPSELWQLLRTVPVECVALAGADGAEQPAREWLGTLRTVKLAIGGDDLLAAGMRPGPELGVALEQALRARLDGELGPGRDEQLAFALASAGR